MAGENEASSGGSDKARAGLSPWWLLVAAIATGAVLTAIAGVLPGAPQLGELTSIEWLGSSATVAALVIAVGIYRLQERASSEAHTEMMDQLEAQNELLHEFAEGEEEKEGDREQQPAPEREQESERRVAVPPGAEPDLLTPEQRALIEAKFGKDSISTAVDPGGGRRGSKARLVRLQDGRLVSVFPAGPGDRIRVREVGHRRRPQRQPRPGKAST